MKKLSPKNISDFQKIVWQYYKQHGRTLPWRKTHNPYKIVVSELMLQQTQVDRVMPKYLAFLKKFPNVKTLAKAPLQEVLMAWQGLGYNRRAIYLQKMCQTIVKKYHGKFPKSAKELEKLPGIGPYTAAAVCTFAYNQPLIVLETNIRRVYIHHFFEDHFEIHDSQIKEVIEKTMDTENPRQWQWALMDYGSHLAKVIKNPNRQSKHYVKQSKFIGSDRQLRGRMLAVLLRDGRQTIQWFAREYDQPIARIKNIAKGLEKDGLIKIDKNQLCIQ